MNISSKDRFPHIRQLKRLGGDKSADGEEYYEEHEKELSKEYKEIMDIVVAREWDFVVRSLYEYTDKQIHGIYPYEQH